MNEFVPLGPIFSDHILPDLQSPIDSVHPIIKVDVIKYVLLFRSIVINMITNFFLNIKIATKSRVRYPPTNATSLLE